MRDTTNRHKFLESRRGRRGALAAGLAGSSGLLALASSISCGRNESSSQATGQPASSPTDGSQAAALTPKRGGVLYRQQTQTPLSLDPHAVPSNPPGGTHFVYSRLFGMAATKPDQVGVVPSDVVPDTAADIKASADSKTFTVTLKPNVKWHPPINRLMDAEDVVFTWKRFTGRLEGTAPSPNAGFVEVIDDVQAMDSRTVVFRLKRQFAPFANLLSDAQGLVLMPKETGTAFDPAKALVGSGPWIFKGYETGVSLSFERNPEWHFGPERPYLDGVVTVIMQDRTNIVNQFLASKLDIIVVNGDELAKVTGGMKGVRIIPLAQANGLVGWWTFSRVSDSGARYTDKRVRHAMSMAIDREALIDAGYGRDKFKKAGYDFEVPWQGVLPAQYGTVVIRPKEDAKVMQLFKFDPKAAKALLDQAGGGFTLDVYDQNAMIYGQEHDTITQLSMQYWNEIGIRTNFKPVDYRSEFIPRVLNGKGFDAAPAVGHVGQAGISDPGVFLASTFTDAGVNSSQVKDPMVQQQLDKYFAEQDTSKAAQVLRDLQYHLIDQMYYIPNGWGVFPQVFAAPPKLHGVEDFRSFGYGYEGLDPTYWWKE
jgi:peptide/nickel transport system substrate-binding protein